MAHSSDKAENQRQFLAAFQYALCIKDACEAAGVTEKTVQLWRRDPEFAVQFDVTNEVRGDFLEERMFNLLDWATQPEQYPLLLKKPTILIFALKAAKREKYGDRGTGGEEGSKKLLEALLQLSDRPTDSSQAPALPARMKHQIEEILDNLDDAS